MKDAGYAITLIRKEETSIGRAEVHALTHKVLTPDKRVATITVYAYRGHVLEKVTRARILQVI